jgi:penicillin-insensitive murein endopeptidase
VKRALALAVLLASPLAGAEPRPPKTASLGSHVSLGFPNAGHLEGGKRWNDTKFARHLPRHAKEATFGMPGLVALLQNAARTVAKAFPKSVLTVGDISAREGGPLPGHHSHQSGRDVDVGFYISNDRGKPVLTEKFVAFDGEGRGSVEKKLSFDDARNWAFVAALLGDGRAEVRTIFVATWLKARLLREAARVKAPKEIVEKATALMMQPPNAEPHDDHFHVRIGCVPSQRGTVCHDDSIERGGASDTNGGISSPSSP